MTKILVNIPQELIEQLDGIAKSKRLSSVWLDQRVQSIPASAFGVLKNSSIGDSVKWQQKVRNELSKIPY